MLTSSSLPTSAYQFLASHIILYSPMHPAYQVFFCCPLFYHAPCLSVPHSPHIPPCHPAHHITNHHAPCLPGPCCPHIPLFPHAPCVPHQHTYISPMHHAYQFLTTHIFHHCSKGSKEEIKKLNILNLISGIFIWPTDEVNWLFGGGGGALQRYQEGAGQSIGTCYSSWGEGTWTKQLTVLLKQRRYILYFYY